MSKQLAGTIALVTGGNSGIGLETARGLAALGARVTIAARDRAKGLAAVEDVRKSTGNADVELMMLDLADLGSVRSAAATFRASHAALHILVNNAGLVLTERRVTKDGFEATFGTNHLGHFLLTRELLGLLKASAPARIVNLSSDAHRQSKGLDFSDLMRERKPYSMIESYGDSKLANVLFTLELARRLEGSRVTAYAVHPGVVATGFARDGDTSGWMEWGARLLAPFLLSPASGARTSLYCATAPELATVSGRYYVKSREKEPAPSGKDVVAAQKLWEVSEQLVAAPAESAVLGWSAG
ncbi:MAG TPA: SDR family oxidoreductase [Myxococcota bacterium]|nr:SDR family oxidoreductase [Myxococcota bacterium]